MFASCPRSLDLLSLEKDNDLTTHVEVLRSDTDTVNTQHVSAFWMFLLFGWKVNQLPCCSFSFLLLFSFLPACHWHRLIHCCPVAQLFISSSWVFPLFLSEPHQGDADRKVCQHFLKTGDTFLRNVVVAIGFTKRESEKPISTGTRQQ